MKRTSTIGKKEQNFEIESIDANGRPSFRHIIDFNCLDEIKETGES